MRFQAAAVSLLMMSTSAAPALAQEAPPAEPVAPLRATTTLSEVPAAPQPTESNSPGMAVGGTVLTVLGGVSMVLGGLGLVGMSGGGGGSALGTVSASMLGGGALFLGIGIPLIVVGAKDVPVDDAPPTPQAQLRVGLGSVDFSMTF
jgi:hypothetical protein